MKNKIIIFSVITVVILHLISEKLQAIPRNYISQFGVTWTFDKTYETGQFVNGDWWVIGPVKVISVSPAPGPADTAKESVRIAHINTWKNNWGATPLRNDYRMRNGSMVNPVWKRNQAYDSGCGNFDASMGVSFPLTLETNSSLISTVSNTIAPVPMLLYFRGATTNSVLKTAAILTCLASVPPADAFRPPYAGTWKPLYRAGNLRRELLPSLEPVTETPTLATVERFVERPYIDHMSGWEGKQGVCPNENMPGYGREYARVHSIVGLRLMLSDPIESKEKLLIGFVQVGIDLYALQKLGAKWQDGGGITSGRKWPVVFAGILLDDQEMKNQPSASPYHEDQQTYYGKGWTGETALWQMINHTVIAPIYEERHPDTWTGIDKRSNGYRMHATGAAWTGQALGALLIKGKEVWNHDAFFDYCDRWMNEGPEKSRVAKAAGSIDLMGTTHDPFVENMYRKYRSAVPDQPGAKMNMKWDAGKWVPDNH